MRTGTSVDAWFKSSGTSGLGTGARVYPLDAYRMAFLICFGLTVAGVVAAALVKETRCRGIDEQRGGSSLP